MPEPNEATVTISPESQELAQEPQQSPPPDPKQVTATAETGLAPVLTNPYNPTHSFGCGCPSCNKKAKLARGEEIGLKAHKSQPAVEKPKIDTKARATHAAEKRWDGERAAAFDWDTAPLNTAIERLANMRRELERGAKAIQQRQSTALAEFVPCHVCKRDIINGRWAMARTIKDPDTQLLVQIFLCGQMCIAKYNQTPSNYPPSGHPITGLPKPELPEAVKAAESKPKEARNGRDSYLD